MKKLVILFLSFLLFSSAFAQNGSQQEPPYKRFPSLPPMKLLLTDSTWFTTENIPLKTATMVMLFDPDCEHCQRETEDILKEIDKFSKITIVMATPVAFSKMKEFYARYDLKRFKNITVGRDVSFTLPVFYDINNLPLLAFYNKKGMFIDKFEGNLSVSKILGKFKE